MDTQKKQQVIDYVKQQMVQGDKRAEGYIFNAQGRENLKRNCFFSLKGYLDDYREKRGSDPIRFLVLYGLRGTGKTTLLSQLYREADGREHKKLFLSVDEITGPLDATLKDVLAMYEEVLGAPFESLSYPVFLFLDEVHFDENWAILLKTIYDRTKNVFIFATGSSALSLQSTPDIARRARFEKLYPLQFTEYIKIRDNRYEREGLSEKLRDILFVSSSDASEVYNRLQDIKPEVQEYWMGLEQQDIEAYLGYGSFPFTATSLRDAVAYDQIKKTIERIVSIDIPRIERFSSDILSKIPLLLYTLASTDQCNLTTLSNAIDINRQTLATVLKTLEKTEIIWRLYPHGQHHTQVRKPSKYLFTSPAFKSMYFSLVESVSQHDNFKGRVLEDAVGLSLRMLFSEKPNFSITYDSSKRGADFIVRYGEKSFVIEVGYGHKAIRQVVHTMTESTSQKSSYGILVSQNPLGVHHDENVVEIPITYFLLL